MVTAGVCCFSVVGVCFVRGILDTSWLRRAGSCKLDIGSLDNLNGQSLPAFKEIDHLRQARISQDYDTFALTSPEIDCTFEHGFRQGVASDHDPKTAKRIGEIAVDLIDVLPLDRFDVLEFKDNLTLTVIGEDILLKIHGPVVVEDHISDQHTRIRPALFVSKIQLRIE